LPTGYRKNGLVDLRRLPRIRTRSLKREAAFGLAANQLFSNTNSSLDAAPIIELDIGLTGRKRMEVVLHEALHHACPWMVEDAVRATARYQAMVLWHLQYRDLELQPE
jgi:hypothetical protein